MVHQLDVEQQQMLLVTHFEQLDSPIYDALSPMWLGGDQPISVILNGSQMDITFSFVALPYSPGFQFSECCKAIPQIVQDCPSFAEQDHHQTITCSFYFKGLPVHSLGYFSLLLEQLKILRDQLPERRFHVHLPGSDVLPAELHIPDIPLTWSSAASLMIRAKKFNNKKKRE